MSEEPVHDRGTDSRYDFGRNWSELAAGFDEEHLDEAAKNLERLVGDLKGKSFLDVGCGSGLHAAAAFRLGASSVYALDYDPRCVEIATTVLARFAAGRDWRVERADALDPSTLPAAEFDVVYSWGVLHHTGDMWSAIRNVAGRVKNGGTYCLALYLKTPLCGLWAAEKRMYSSRRWLRPPIKAAYVLAFMVGKTIRSGNAAKYVRDYRKARGMEFMVDVDDWLGGYPYQSVRPAELEAFVEDLGFSTERRFSQKAGLGIFGTGCGEWNLKKSVFAESHNA